MQRRDKTEPLHHPRGHMLPTPLPDQRWQGEAPPDPQASSPGAQRLGPTAKRALMRLGRGSRALVKYVPRSIKLGRTQIPYRSLRYTFEIVAGLVFVCFLLLVLGHIRLSRGPVSLDFLVTPLESAMNRELTGLKAHVGRAVMRYGENGGGLQFRLTDVEIKGKDGTLIAKAPLASVGLSASALLSGKFAPERIELIGPRLLVANSADGGLSVRFAGTRSGGNTPAGTRAPKPNSAATAHNRGADTLPHDEYVALRRFSLAKTLSKTLAQARANKTTSSYLKSVGVRDALIFLERNGKTSTWKMPKFSVTLEHKKHRSFLSGRADISTGARPWSVAFRAEESGKAKRLALQLVFEKINPSALPASLVPNALLSNIDLPISGEAILGLSQEGRLESADLTLSLGGGAMGTGLLGGDSVRMKDSRLRLRFDPKHRQVLLLPSSLAWQGGRATVRGVFAPRKIGNGARSWDFRIATNSGQLLSPAGAPLAIDALQLLGSFTPSSQTIRLDQGLLRLGQAQVSFAGLASGDGGVTLNGRFSKMSMQALIAVWPRWLAGNARHWLSERVKAGDLRGARVRIALSKDEIHRLASSGNMSSKSLSFVARLANLRVRVVPGLPLVNAPGAELHVAGKKLRLAIPKASFVLAGRRRMALRDGKFEIPDLFEKVQKARLEFKYGGRAPVALALLDQPRFRYAHQVGIAPRQVRGKARGQIRFAFPLLADLTFKNIQMRGRSKLSDISIDGAASGMPVRSGEINISLTEKAIQAQGDILVNGVPAKLTWQRIFDAPANLQPPLRVTTTLDAADRRQLGLAINHMLEGELPVVLTISKGADRETRVHFHANLTNATLRLENMAWTKPAGQPALMEFDIRNGPGGKIELQNFKIDGENIAIDGWIALDADKKLVEFVFPDFSFNVITHLEMSGKRGSDGIWRVDAKGSSFDARDLFRAILSAAPAPKRPPSQLGKGVDVRAQIDTIVGFSDSSLRKVTLTLSKRDGKLKAFSGQGVLRSGVPLIVKVEEEPKIGRILVAATNDAGEAFRLVGFYKSIKSGRATLRVNLDGNGIAERTGILWAQNFAILGDRVVEQVLSRSNEDAGTSAKRRRRRGKREELFFELMRIPFSIGQGQFVLEKSHLRGPAVGATLHGKVDFGRHWLHLRGTYIPLYGLNSAFGVLPFFGELLVGRRGEGLVGITFAIKGDTRNPQVIANPLSIAAPGFLRQIFEFSPQAEHIDPRRPDAPPAPPPTRSSSLPPIKPPKGDDGGDGWAVTIDN